MLARRDLNWSATNARLYNEAFTGCARTLPRCPHCLAEDHQGMACPHNPNPPILGWLQSPSALQWIQPQAQPQPTAPARATTQAPCQVCCYYNVNRCRFTRCRYSHVCTDCGGPHPALGCPTRQSPDHRPPPQGHQHCSHARSSLPTSHQQAIVALASS